MNSHDRARRTYTQTELWMSYGLTAGLILGVFVQILTGSPVWIGPSFILGLVIGMAIGQVRDQRRQDDDHGSDDGA